eukprot:gnl/Hemi2/22401_TR7466_c0_g1_i1.p1 gnl/Hemi2/22401_TR7466_c0_g1~~gnl/Hemi2/22401_TR7466_c0_g1_i1.p1  ORF type:complete len:234 (-),score=68.53 gnl/Hemi2/22401_TR7466_c0_g1_i1:174-833(-)
MSEAPNLASLIDHTLLKPDATSADVVRLCREAVQHKFFCVCVNAVNVPLAVAELSGSDVVVCGVVGFPLGATPTVLKAAEAAWVVSAGAKEVDMVIHIGALKENRVHEVREDIAAVKHACGAGVLLKVILEAFLLTDAEKRLACSLCVEAGADFVKTSTGFAAGGATVEDVALMRSVVGSQLGVKASAGIRTRQAALAMVEAGASRIGTSAGVQIVTCS